MREQMQNSVLSVLALVRECALAGTMKEMRGMSEPRLTWIHALAAL